MYTIRQTFSGNGKAALLVFCAFVVAVGSERWSASSAMAEQGAGTELSGPVASGAGHSVSARLQNALRDGRADKKAWWESLTPAERKIDAHLLRTARGIQALQMKPDARSIAAAFSVPRFIRANDEGDLQCYVVLHAITEDRVETLRELGLRVEVVSERMRLVQGWLAASRLEAMAELPFVTRIKRPDYARHRSGLYLTEGLAIHRADQLQVLGITGAGVKVGVISDGVDSCNGAAATGDLPETSPGSGIADVEINPSLPGSGDEGTAMLEIIHDLAPDASLAFSGAMTSAGKRSAICNGLLG